MKVYTGILALCLFHANVWESTAFSVGKATKVSATVLRSTEAPFDVDALDLFPDIPLTRMEGGSTIRTFKLPVGCERVEMFFKTNGRPLKANVNLWLGPIRQTHNMNIDCMDGSLTPYRSILKFKNTDSGGNQMLKLRAGEELEYPMEFWVRPADEERNKQLIAYTKHLWKNAPNKKKIQGGNTDGKGGMIHTFPVPNDVDAINFIASAQEVGKKSFRMKLEICQGPNNNKQAYTLQCGGGSQPFHAIFQTPGAGWIVRVTNLKFLEDGLFQAAVVPYTGKKLPVAPGRSASSMDTFGQVGNRDWWMQP